jgi:ornithine cyclodeaminase
VRPIRRVRVWSRSAANARAFAERESRRAGVSVEVMRDARAAVEGADLICTVTAARDPVLFGDWIAPGAHINAAGGFAADPASRELDTRAVVRARLYVDRRESTRNEAGDFLVPRKEGAIGEDHIVGEIGDVLLGRVPGRRSREEITLFKSLGIAVEDLAAAHAIVRNARKRGGGTEIDFGGRRDAGG